MKDQTIDKTVISTQDNHDQQIGQTLQQIQTYLERINTPQLEEGKKILLHTSKKRRPCCTPAGKENPVTHQQGKKTLLRFT